MFGFWIFVGGCTGSSGGGGGAGNLSGSVAKLNYAPVSNASVVTGSDSTTTLSNGTYSFTNLSGGEKILKITHTAYTSAYRKATVSGGTTTNADIAFIADLDSKTTPIPTAGGVATSTNGSIKMVFQNGSLSSPSTDIVLTSVPKIAAPYNPPEGSQFVSYIVYAKPEETQTDPSKPAKLSVPNLTGITTQDVTFYRFNPDTYLWESIGIGHASLETNTIDVDTKYLGWIAAIVPITPPPGTIIGTINNIVGGSPIAGANVWTTTSYAVTNSLGQYTLRYVPIGTTEVHCSALGFDPPITTPVVTVYSEQTATCNISMTQVSQGTITGTIRSSNGGVISGARITESHGGETYSNSYGVYTLYNVPVGTGATDVSVFANSHQSTKESVPVVGGGSTNKNFTLQYIPGGISTYFYDFELTDEGFTTTGSGLWHRQSAVIPITTNPRNAFVRQTPPKIKLTSGDLGYMPAQHGGSAGYYFWYGQEAIGDASKEASYIGLQEITDTWEGSGGVSDIFFNNVGSLESPNLNLAGYLYGKLSFWSWWEVEGMNPATGYDKMLVMAKKTTDSSWTLLGALNPWEDPIKQGEIVFSGEAYSSGGYYQPGIWVKHSFDLSSYAGSQISIRFMFDSGDRFYNGYRGWLIDDVMVTNEAFGISGFGEITNVRRDIITKPRN
jgi:hypothetical protein